MLGDRCFNRRAPNARLHLRAHPVGCAVGVAMIDLVIREDFPGQAAAKGERLLRGLRDALPGHPHAGEVRGLGLMCAVECPQRPGAIAHPRLAHLTRRYRGA